MKNKNIIVLTGAIQTGKSTAVLDWAKDKVSIVGFLSLEIDGMRKLLSLENGDYHEFQIPQKQTTEDVSVGKFIFSGNSFNWAKKCILSAIDNAYQYFLADELGKLEMMDIGLQPALGKLIKHYQSIHHVDTSNGKLILIIRDTLLDDAIEKFELKGCKIIKKEQINALP